MSRKSGKGTYTGEHLTNWILQYYRGGCTLSNGVETGVMFCDIEIVKKCLMEHDKSIEDCVTHLWLRLQMQAILQLEEELTQMTLCMRDIRFSPGHPSAHSLPVDRLISDHLHIALSDANTRKDINATNGTSVSASMAKEKQTNIGQHRVNFA